MIIQEEPATYYDAQFASSEIYRGAYQDHPLHRWGIWHAAAGLVPPGAETLCDIGCGTGQFLAFLSGRTSAALSGVDFSDEGIRQARRRLPEDVAFRHGDLCTTSVSADVVTAFEVLEHITDDLGVVKRCRCALFIGSVPSYWSRGHVRIFPDADAVRSRYGQLLNNLEVETFQLKPHASMIHLFWGMAA